MTLTLERVDKIDGLKFTGDDVEKIDNNSTLIENIVNNLVANKANIVYENPITPTLINSWVNYGNGYSTVGYWKDSLGYVHLKGTIKNGNANSIAFQLPIEYRPNNIIVFPCAGVGRTDQGDLTGICQILITNDGNVIPLFGDNIANSNISKISLDGVRFRVGV